MIVGGLRARLLQDSLHLFLLNGLTTLGWLDSNRRHRPVRIQAQPARWQEPIEPNLIALDFLSVDNREFEVGSNLTADDLLAHIEIYAESDSLGIDLSNDVRDLVRGRLTSIGSGGSLPVFDLRQGNPPIIGHLHVDRVSAIRNVSPTEDAWVRHWYRVRCEFTDVYATSEA